VNLSIFQEWFSLLMQYDPLPALLCQYPISWVRHFLICRSRMFNSRFFHCISSCVHTFLALSMFLLFLWTALLSVISISLNWPHNLYIFCHCFCALGAMFVVTCSKPVLITPFFCVVRVTLEEFCQHAVQYIELTL
jgi:hypothetical protein